jgi:hypothetical protein
MSRQLTTSTPCESRRKPGEGATWPVGANVTLDWRVHRVIGLARTTFHTGQLARPAQVYSTSTISVDHMQTGP